LDLDYRAPSACPSAEEFTSRVKQTLQRPLDRFERRSRFQVTIAAVARGYRLTIHSEVHGERGTRSLAGADCSSVADAGALSIALALSNAREPRDRAAPSANFDSNSPAKSAEPRRTFATVDWTEPARTTMALHLLGDYGTFPRLAPGARLSFGLSGRRWAGRLGFVALLPVTHWVDGRTSAVGGRFWFGAARAEGCVRAAGDARTSVDGCLLFEAGAVSGVGVGVDVPKTDTLAWLAPGGRVVGALPLMTSRAQVLLGVEGLVPLLTQRFTVESGRTELYAPSRFVGRVDIGVGWHF
jgi:hypothetical protein